VSDDELTITKVIADQMVERGEGGRCLLDKRYARLGNVPLKWKKFVFIVSIFICHSSMHSPRCITPRMRIIISQVPVPRKCNTISFGSRSDVTGNYGFGGRNVIYMHVNCPDLCHEA